MDLASGATSIESLRALLDASVEVRKTPDHPRLHAKVFILGNATAVVTSANLTRNAFESNLEVGAVVDSFSAKQLLKWFDDLWEDAEKITVEDLASIREQTDKLRREYRKFKTAAKIKLSIKQKSSSKLPSSLAKLLNNAKRSYLVNTNRRNDSRTQTGGYLLEERMMERGLAAVWDSFNYAAHINAVRRGDAIFAFAKRVGIIGVGVAEGECEVIEGDSEDRIRSVKEYDYAEWRVPTRWLAWVDNKADALPYKHAPNASFVDVSGENYDELRESIRQHFAGFFP